MRLLVAAVMLLASLPCGQVSAAENGEPTSRPATAAAQAETSGRREPPAGPPPTARVGAEIRPATRPVGPTVQPVGPTMGPVGPTTQPVGPTMGPVGPTIEPADPTTQPSAQPATPAAPAAVPASLDHSRAQAKKLPRAKPRPPSREELEVVRNLRLLEDLEVLRNLRFLRHLKHLKLDAIP